MKNYADISHSRELGYLFPDAEWWWVRIDDNDLVVLHKDYDVPIKDYNYSTERIYPAITTDMCLEILPDNIDGFYHELTIRKQSPDYQVSYSKSRMEIDKSLPNALCKLIQLLVKEGIINDKK